nr:ribonuclease H-like domain-containing protein [Tanacetum cinerariifolium]
MDVEVENDDLNQKFLTSLAPEWLMHTIVWRNKNDLDTMSLDDLYNHLKVYEAEVQRKSNLYSQNMAFISSSKHSKAPIEFALMANTESKVFDNSLCSNDCKKNNDSLNSKIKDLTDELFEANNYIYHYKLAVAQIKGRLVEYKEREVKYIEKVRTLEMYKKSNLKCIETLGKELETLKLEKDGADGKLAGLLKASKNLDNLIESQRSDKVKDGIGYNVVPPPAADLYFSPKKDLSWTGLHKFVDDTVIDYSRPMLTIKSTLEEDQNKNSSTSEDVASPILPKPFVKSAGHRPHGASMRPSHRPAGHRPHGPSINPMRPNMNEEIFPLSMGNFPLLAEYLPLVAQKFTLLIWEGREKLSHNNIDDKDYWDSGCSRHMTGNISYLSDFEPFDRGYVSFGQGGFKITGNGTIKTGKLEFENVYFVKDLKYNLFSVSQICDNKNSVLFTDSECIVLGRNFKLTKDETSNILKKFITEIENLKDLKVKIISTKVPEGSKNPNPTASSSNPPTDQIETLTVESLIPTDSSPVPTACLNDSLEPSSEARLISKRVANQEETPSLDNILSLTNQFEDILGIKSSTYEAIGVEADFLTNGIRDWRETLILGEFPSIHISRSLFNSQKKWIIIIEFDDSYKVPTTTDPNNTTTRKDDKKSGRTVTIKTEDMQRKKNDVKARTTLLLSLPDEHQLRNDLDTMSLNDLYNHLKVYEAEVQRKSNPYSQNMAFISSSKHSSGDEDGNTACVPIASITVPTASASVATISQDTANKFWKKTRKKISIQGSDVAGFDKLKVECFNFHKMGHFTRECRPPRSQERGRKDNYRQGSKTKEKTPKALMAIDEAGWDWSYMANDGKDHALVADAEAIIEFALMANTESKVFNNSLCSNDSVAQLEGRLVKYKEREVKYIEKIRTLEMYKKSNLNCIETLGKELETLKLEKDGVDGKLAVLLKASKNLDNLIESQRSDKVKDRVGYNVVPPAAADLYFSPKKDLSWTGLHKFVDDTIIDYSRPMPTIKSTSEEDQNKNSSTSEDVASPILPKPFVKFVKPKDTQSEKNKKETPKKSQVKYAEQYIHSNKKPNVKGNQRNWTNLKSCQLGLEFVLQKKACFNCGDFSHLANECRKRVQRKTTRSQNHAYMSPSHRSVGHRPHGAPMRPPHRSSSYRPHGASMRPSHRPAGHRPHGPSMNPMRPNMNGANRSFFIQAHSYETRPFLKTSAVKTQYRAPWVPSVNRNNPPVNRKFSTSRRNFPTVNGKFPTTSRIFTTGSTKIHTTDIGRKGKAIKPSACCVWNPS